MTEFVRPIHKHIKDLFILDIEALCDFADNLKYHAPDSLCESNFHTTSGSIHEESSCGLIVGESFGRGEYVVLHGRDDGHRNLRGEVAHLVLAKSKVSFAFLEYDLQRPTLGVNPISLNEIKRTICGNESVPFSPFSALAEEETDVASCEYDIYSNVVASQATAIRASLLRMVEESDKLICGVLPTFIYILRAAHLYHTEIVTLHMAGGDELDDFGTCKPAVRKDVVKVNLTLDDTAYHLHHQGNLALVILFNTLCCMGVRCVFLGEPRVKLLLLQAIVALLSFLSNEGKVEKHLADAVSDADEESLETEHHRMRHVGVYLADKLSLHASLGIVGVIHHQADRLCAVSSPLLLGLAPELERDHGHNSAPVVRFIRQETIERVALTAELAA